jgi:membrane-associated phospholipid phosphatase
LLCALAILSGVAPIARRAAADETAPPAPKNPPPAKTPPTAGQTPTPAESEERATSITPKPVEPVPPVRFEAEPIRDGAIILMNVSFAGLLGLITGTGELHPQQIAKDFNSNSLLFFDRVAVTQTIDPNAGTYSDIGVLLALAYAIGDPIATGYRESNVQSALVDFIIYAEALSITWGLTNLAKAAVRRPRPTAYILAAEHEGDPNFVISDFDSSASFFSGHTSTCAAVTAVATYLAFARSPGTARPWITLIVGGVLTGLVGFERVRSGSHFPSDVFAGMLAGSGVGVLVTHYHRAESAKERPLWIGFVRETNGEGGMFTLGGTF